MDEKLITILDRTYQATAHTVACLYSPEEYYTIRKLCTHPTQEENPSVKCDMCGGILDSSDSCQSCFWMYY